MSNNQKDTAAEKATLARHRWSLLRQAIIKKSIPETMENPASKRVFERFSDIIFWNSEPSKCLMNVHVRVPFVHTEPNGDIWRNVGSGVLGNCVDLYSVKVHRKNSVIPVDIRNLKGFDKTGRICIWPSEQILTYWILDFAVRVMSKTEDPPRRLLEIGGGFHCLAGLAFAKYSTGTEVVLTDGDEVNIEEVTCSIQRNNIGHICRAETLRWGKDNVKPEMVGYFDYIIAADVVYERDQFTSLLETIATVLKPYGCCIIFNPCRDGMLYEFINLAKTCSAFSQVKLAPRSEYYLPRMLENVKKENKAFNEDWHFPCKIHLVKSSKYNKNEPFFREDKPASEPNKPQKN